jgi:peptidoglycan biosynthesis protein MviN/MurJ (putative lipid II flippase)
MMKKIIGIYMILLGLSGIILILGFIWLVYNISTSMAGEKSLLSYIFGINIYIFITLLVAGVLGLILNTITKYVSNKK